MKKRLLSLFLTAVMIIGLLPTTALAAETELTVTNNVIDITDKTALGGMLVADVQTVTIEGANVKSATEDGTTINVTLEEGTDPSAELVATFTCAVTRVSGPNPGILTSHSGNTLTLSDGSGSMTVTVTVTNAGASYMKGSVEYTINFTTAAPSGPSIRFDTDLDTSEVRYIKNADAAVLTVEAVHSEGTAVSYQWYKNTENSTADGTIIEGETGVSYTPATNEYGTMYYYVVASGEGVEDAASKAAMITVLEPYLTFTAQPQSKEYVKGGAAPAALTVEAAQSEGADVTYQWYKDGTPIDGATSMEYTPDISEAGTAAYYAAAISKDKNGEDLLTMNSDSATISVRLPKVSFTQNLSGSALYLTNTDSVTALTVSATQELDAEVSYQWYKNTTNSTTGGAEVGANSDAYTPDVSAPGEAWYYVVASAYDSTPATSGTYYVNVRDMDVEFTTDLSESYNAYQDGSLTLTVEAKPTVSDAMENWAEKLTYQWYRNDAASSTGGTLIEGAAEASYTVPTDQIGTYYYYVVATLDSNYTAVSSAATVSVTYSPTTIYTNGTDGTGWGDSTYAYINTLSVSGVKVDSYTWDGDSCMLYLDSDTPQDAEVTFTYTLAGSMTRWFTKATLNGTDITSSKTGSITLEDGAATAVIYAASNRGNRTKTINIQLTPTEAPTCLHTEDSVTAYPSFETVLDVSQYFDKADTYYLVKDGGEKEQLTGNTYSFTPPAAGTYTYTFAASNKKGGMCEDLVTVTATASDVENGTWIRQITSNGVLESVTFTDPDGNAIEGLTTSLDGTTITVSLPRTFEMGEQVKASFTLTQTDGLPFVSGGNGWQQGKGTTTEYTTTISGGTTTKNIYLYNSVPSAVNNTYTTYVINYTIANQAPVLAEGQAAAGTAAITADKSYTLDLDGIFTDPDGDTIAGWKVSVNGGAAVDAVVDAENVYSYNTTESGEYTLVFQAVDSYNAVSSDTYTVTLTVSNAETTYDVTVNVPEGVAPTFYCTADAQDSTTLTAENSGTVYTVAVPGNISILSWRYDGMGMSTAVSEGCAALTLVKADFVATADDVTDTGAAVAIAHGTDTVVGNGNSYLLLAGEGYTFTATPSTDFTASWKETTLTSQTVTESGTVIIPLTSRDITITVPYYATLKVGPASSVQGVRPTWITPSGTVANPDNTKTVSYKLTTGTVYEYRVSYTGYADYCGTFEKTENFSMTVTYDQITAGGADNVIDRELAAATSKSMEAADVGDLLLDVNAQGYLKLAANETYQLHPMRLWWGSNIGAWAIADYYFVEPDFHYAVMNLDGSAADDSVLTVDENGKITAVGEGTAIVLVTYDAMTLDHDDSLKKDSLYHDPDGSYSAIWPENTGVFVVSVGAGDSGITTGMTINEDKTLTSKAAGTALDSELDVIYFIGDKGEYTFTPGTDGVTVSVANPSINDDKLSFSGFETVDANDDGSYTVPLTEGRNIVKLEKEGRAEYQVITAKSVNVTVNGTALEKAVVSPGETVSIVFDTIYNPANRSQKFNSAAAAVYGAVSGYEDMLVGNARGEYGYYYFAANAANQTVANFVSEANGAGYGNHYVLLGDELIVPADFEGEYFTLSDGAFNAGGFSSYKFGDHRSIGSSSSGMSSSLLAYLGKLPDISIPVDTVKGISVTTQPDTTAYAIGDVFDPAGMVVTITYSNGKTAEVSNYTYDTAAFTESGNQQITINYGGKTTEVTVNVAEVKLERIEVTQNPNKTMYYAGDAFEPSGMEVTAYYDDGSSKVVTNYTYAPETLSKTDTAVTITYGNSSTTVPVKISLVESIAVTTQPDKTTYTVDEYFDPTGMVITATYGDGSTAEITDYTFAPTGKLTTGDTAITITYSGDEGASGLQPVTLPITVKSSGSGTGGGGSAAPKTDSITVYVSYMDNGEIVEGVDGTLLYNVPIEVEDEDEDGKYTLGEAFEALHAAYYRGGVKGYDDDGNLVTDFWGDGIGGLAYVVNHKWVRGISVKVEDGDQMAAFRHQDDSGSYSDLYTWFAKESYSAKTGEEKSFTVNGLNIMASSASYAATASPEGATVTVYNKNGSKISSLSTTTDENGQFQINFPDSGTYTIEISGTCSYSYSGGYGSGSISDAPVVPSRCTVYVSGNAVTKAEEEETELPFTDVSDGDYYYEAVKWAVEQNITNGTTDTTFAPGKGCTRAQMVTFLWRAAGSPEPASVVNAFTDVNESGYYYKALLWAIEKGITKGTTETTFSPNAVCTRGQMAAFLYRNAGSPAVSGTDPFMDVQESDYFADAVVWAVKEGVTNGTTETTFSPNAACTRGQMVTFLYRLLADTEE